MNRTRTALVTAVAAATLAASVTVVSALPATAAVTGASTAASAKVTKPKAKPKKVEVKNLITTERQSLVFSPNGDKVLDRARVSYTLKRKSVVTMKMWRVHESKDWKLLRTKKLGTVARGKYAYKWNGKKPSGKVMRDGRYQISFFADPVKHRLKKGSAGTQAYLDTRYSPEALEASSTTVYPNTTVIADEIAFNHGGYSLNKGPGAERIGKVTLVVKDSAGNTVRSQPQDYQNDLYYPVTWDGRDDNGAVLPAGQYSVHLDVTDTAGNSGTSPSQGVTVSAAPLVLAGDTRTVAPVNGALPPAPASTSAEKARADGRSSTNGGDDSPTQPCGVVFASTIYPAPGASFRSKAGCGWAINHAIGSGTLPLRDLNAPRGLASAQMTMRGRPTLDGEADTAQLSMGFLYDSSSSVTVTTPSAPGEAMTSTPVARRQWNASGYPRSVGVEWTIRTVGFDAYDVADLTLDFTYLTPQIS